MPVGKLGISRGDGSLFCSDHEQNFVRLGGPGLPIAPNLRFTQVWANVFGSWHSGICHFALCDGSTKPVANSIDPDTLGRLTNRRDGASTYEGSSPSLAGHKPSSE